MGVALAASLFLQLVTSFCWRYKLQHYWTEGRCRVEKVEIAWREGAYEVDVTHRLELPGRENPAQTNAEEQTPSSPNKAKAELLAARYRVGELYPCWYRPERPDDNYLLRDGIDLWWPLRALWFPVVMGGVAFWCCRWTWRRWKARRWEVNSG